MARSSDETFTAEERAAMKERAREAKLAKKSADLEADVLKKIAEMPEAERVIAQRVHDLVREHAPDLQPRTMYGMPAYYRDGKKNVLFFQAASKFKTRYSTIGFDEASNLDEGTMWPMSWAITEWNDENERRFVALLTRAVDWHGRD